METELKIRCYDRVFPQLKDKALARAIQEFEWKLAEATRKRGAGRTVLRPIRPRTASSPSSWPSARKR